ncbi:precorrin-8X methylmutase [Kushneria sinocarnis]|uniref:Precorrin-8X methylmutase n=1 Tax=Kushneria sinocarnis TaxID=595502 RepID=A0A420X111_9GAMM|nr:precorrin-8X methylmutase [Kushneria sinocarnis]RKR07531.1 precorrin-8X methylmutase [Kushneria sinocarnis]
MTQSLESSFDYIRDGREIYRQSFAIIREEAALERFSELEAEIAIRMIHACGLVELAEHIEFGGDAASVGRRVLQSGMPILCDAEMVDRGITRKRLPAGNEVHCTLRDERTPQLAAELGNTRSAAALELWGMQLAGAVVVIGNAPTALFHLLERLEQGALPRPALIVGVPVGFVGARESKQALAASRLGIPFITVHGRMGGSAIASATVNALASAAL